MLSIHHHVHAGPSPKDGIVSLLRIRAMIRPCAASCAVSRNDVLSGSIRARRAVFPPISPCLKSTRAESAPSTESNFRLLAYALMRSRETVLMLSAGKEGPRVAAGGVGLTERFPSKKAPSRANAANTTRTSTAGSPIPPLRSGIRPPRTGPLTSVLNDLGHSDWRVLQ